MTSEEKIALTNARRAVSAMSDQPQTLVEGSIRQLVDGFEIRLSSAAAVYVVRTTAEGEVESVDEQEVH